MTHFKRAKSKENKKIRFQEIMNATDQLFHQYSYHEFGLSEIAQATNIVRSGLYKYVSSKEEIFLAIYLQKQKQTVSQIMQDMTTKPKTIEGLAQAISKSFYQHLDYIKYHQILNAIIETNVSVEKLADFKLKSAHDRQLLLELITFVAALDNQQQAFDLYLTILYHSVYLYDRIVNRKKYVEAMTLAQLPIYPVDFQKELYSFTVMVLTHSKPSTQ